MTTKRDELAEHYREARCWIVGSPFVREMKWQQEVQALVSLSEESFLREYAWVVLNSGFREAVVRKHFDYISLCFCDWESAAAIVEREDVCVQCALSVFGNKRKLEAITQTARLIVREGFEAFIARIRANALTELEELPFIGSITKWHLAKNIGLDVAKPDRHLVRLAQRFGYTDVQLMCRDVVDRCGDSVAVADIILWRFEERRSQLEPVV